MQFQIPIDTLFTQVFGIVTANIRRYPNVNMAEDLGYNKTFENIEVNSQTSNNEVYNSFGEPVLSPMGFLESQEYLVRRNGELKKETRIGMWLPFTSVATFSRAKRYTETYMSGQQGSVIEEYGFEPWNIRVQGFIIKNDKALAGGKTSVAEQIKELESYEELSDAIGVKGDLFEWLGIHNVSITNIVYPEARNLDMAQIKPFEMTLRSVEPTELILP